MDILNGWVVPPEATCGASAYIGVGVVALLTTAVSKGGFGGAVGMFSVPLMLQVAPYRFVIGVWLPVLIACDICTINRYPRQWSPRALYPIAPGLMIGIVAGACVLWLVGDDSDHAVSLKLCVGILAILFLVMTYWMKDRQGDHGQRLPWRPTFRVAVPLGTFLGVATTVAHAGGPLLMMYMLPQRLEKRVFVGTCGRFYLFFNGVKVPFLVWVGCLNWHTLKYAVWLMLLGLPFVWVGSLLNRRVSSDWFVRIIELCLAIAAAKLIWDWVVVALSHAAT